jgi:hypothetical protein
VRGKHDLIAVAQVGTRRVGGDIAVLVQPQSAAEPVVGDRNHERPAALAVEQITGSSHRGDALLGLILVP